MKILILMKKQEKNIRFMNAKKGIIHHLTASVRILKNTGLENIKSFLQNAIYANTEKNVQKIVIGYTVQPTEIQKHILFIHKTNVLKGQKN